MESEGSDLLNDVERLRLASIEFRKEPTEARRRGITEMVSALDVERAALVARAFTIYFHLVNLAEERHRVRALRKQARGPEPVPESIEAAVAEIRSREGNDALRRELAGRRWTRFGGLPASWRRRSRPARAVWPVRT